MKNAIRNIKSGFDIIELHKKNCFQARKLLIDVICKINTFLSVILTEINNGNRAFIKCILYFILE